MNHLFIVFSVILLINESTSQTTRGIFTTRAQSFQTTTPPSSSQFTKPLPPFLLLTTTTSRYTTEDPEGRPWVLLEWDCSIVTGECSGGNWAREPINCRNGN
jgi:hypothetical protein